MLGAVPAFGQTTAEPAHAATTSAIVPPRLTTPVTASYPSNGHGDAVVILAVTVGVDGSVQALRVVEGDEPFASAAVDAARSLHFEPAESDGRAVAATIRFELTYQAPRGVEPPPKARAAPSAAPAAPAAMAPIEVTVQSQRLAPAARSMSRVQVRELPGAFGDPLRAIDALPGVTPLVSGAPFFYVRGAPPGNVGYFLDGVRIPYLYHVGIGPSVVHPAIVDHVDLYSGGYPARFGRFAGGIVAAETTAPRSELHGEGNVRVFDLGAVAEGGFADGRGSALLGGRYSYTAAIVSLLAPDVKIDYRDYQARVAYDVTPDDRVSLFSFGSYDVLGEVKNGVVGIFFGSEFYRADLRYDHRFGEDGTLRGAVTLGFDQTRIAEERNGQTRLAASRVEFEHRVGDSLRLRAGSDVTLERYGATALAYDDPENPDVQHRNALFPARDDVALGGYADVVVAATPDIEVVPGVRVDLFTSGNASALGVDPRIAARFRVAKGVRIVHAYGIAHQPPSYVAPIPGLVPGTLRSGLQTSFQTSAGVELDLPAQTTASATLFDDVFLRMTDAAGTSPDFDVTSTDLTGPPERRSLGSSVGLEILLRRSLTQRLGGFVSYTLSRSMRSVGRETFPSNFDRTHVANAALGYDLGRHWRAGGRVLFYTGTPKSYRSSGLIVAPRPRNPDRSPPFYRIDVRLEKRWPLSEKAWLSFVFEVLNATLSRETFSTATGGSDQTVGPVTIPSIGVEGGF